MKQMVTVFRAEGQQADRVLRLCSESDDASIFGLREHFRGSVHDSDAFTAYTEFIDHGSMGDDFTRAIGPEVEERYVSSGVVYLAVVTESLIEHTREHVTRYHQFPEQARLAGCINDFTTTRWSPDEPAIVVVFREILGSKDSGDESKKSNKAQHPIA